MAKKTVFLVTSQIKNFIQTYNNQLKNAYKTIKDDDTENSYLVLINEDLKANLKDDKKFIDDYIDWAEKWNLPYTFFPYYGTFNKAMIKCSKGIPHPFYELTLAKKDNEVVDIVHQISPGCIILNVNKLKSIDFKFDVNLPTMFYLQDLVEKCYRAKLWISNCWYIDRLHSWEDLKELTTECKFPINFKNFQDEQKKYFEGTDYKYKDPNQIIEDLKKWLNGEDIPVETNPQVNVAVQNSNINISVPSELMKKDSPVIEVKPESLSAPPSPSPETEKIMETFNNNQKAQKLAQMAEKMEQELKAKEAAKTCNC